MAITTPHLDHHPVLALGLVQALAQAPLDHRLVLVLTLALALALAQAPLDHRLVLVQAQALVQALYVHLHGKERQTGIQLPRPHDGKLYKTSSGDYMYIQCCTDRNNGLLLGADTVADFGECRANSINCALWAHGGFSPDESFDEGHHAYFVEAPYVDQPDDDIELCSTQCPGAHNQVFTSQYGETFLMICGKRHGTPGVSQFVDSYEQCIDTCGLVGQCKSVDYHHRTGSCTFGDHGGEPLIDAPGYASAWSMGCSGACKKYPKPPPPADEKHCPGPGGYHMGNWAVDGQPWLTRCSTYMYNTKHGNSYILDAAATSVEECMKKCQDDSPRCVWGSFNFASGECTGFPGHWDTIETQTDGKVTEHVNFGRHPSSPGMAPAP
ncbi:hypothetical protein EYZ11_012470 [Aspergillus tanneri]|uniref:Apple domain-containing protein n=1 Tax=Aspergillus tanneri TaxID=1220188 RepID=A0A4S3J056_9EURO|nr:hypothetical protein EYZ11_012470 [Aspergillus tanneri]